MPEVGILTLLEAVAVCPSAFVARTCRYHVPLVCRVVTVFEAVCGSSLQPEVGIVAVCVHAYSSLPAFVAVMLPVSVPLLLVRLFTITVGLAALLTEASVV